MTKYQLAKLISLAQNATIESRKRIQKVVYLLQEAGMSLANDFRLHHYGPYSSEVAGLLDDLSASGILEEDEEAFERGVQYNYSVSESANAALQSLEEHASKSIKEQQSQFNKFKGQINRLLQVEDLWVLELSSTMAFYHQKGMNWEEASKSACEYKKYPLGSPKTLEALELAKDVVG